MGLSSEMIKSSCKFGIHEARLKAQNHHSKSSLIVTTSNGHNELILAVLQHFLPTNCMS